MTESRLSWYLHVDLQNRAIWIAPVADGEIDVCERIYRGYVKRFQLSHQPTPEGFAQILSNTFVLSAVSVIATFWLPPNARGFCHIHDRAMNDIDILRDYLRYNIDYNCV